MRHIGKLFSKVKFLFFFAVVLAICSLIVMLFLINQQRESIQNIEDVNNTNVAIVFGAGIIGNSIPSGILADRLDVAADLFHQEKIKAILVSGDNRFENYSEPDVMRRYLMNTHDIPEEFIYEDFAGRRTYDTCRRAVEIWGIENALLVTQDFHLPRALFLCHHLGVEGIGISASLRPYTKEEFFRLREILAFYKAILDIYLFEPDYIKGDFIEDLDN